MNIRMKTKRYSVYWDYSETSAGTIGVTAQDDGYWCKSEDVGKLEARIIELENLLRLTTPKQPTVMDNPIFSPKPSSQNPLAE